MDTGAIGGIVGAAIGVLGGIIGTYFSIRHAVGPIEKAFMIRVSAIFWITLALFLAILFFLPADYKFLAWLSYAILVPCGIFAMNKKLQEIRNGGPDG